MDQNILIIIICSLVVAVAVILLMRRRKGCGCKESFEAPDKIIKTGYIDGKIGGYHFHDHGIGAHLYQADWSRGTFFQPWVSLDQGLYSNGWNPRFIKHEL